MKAATFALGLLGGILGTLVALFAVAYAGASTGFNSGPGRFVLIVGLSAIAGTVAGVASASLYLAGKWPKLMAAVLAFAALWHIASLRIASISAFGMIGGFLMLLAALLAIVRELMQPRSTNRPKIAVAGTRTSAKDDAGRP